jgi:hypothetical protein
MQRGLKLYVMRTSSLVKYLVPLIHGRISLSITSSSDNIVSIPLTNSLKSGVRDEMNMSIGYFAFLRFSDNNFCTLVLW